MKTKNLNYPIFYLTREDIDNNGNIISKDIPSDIPILIMMQTSGCGWCVKAKPEYQSFANKYGYCKKDKNYKKLYDKYKNQNEYDIAFVTTIQPGKDEGFTTDVLNKIDENFEGFPHFLVIKNNKKYTYEGERNASAIKKFIENLN